jgi:arylsulfatase A-like enzyme/HEAT repeat protein
MPGPDARLARLWVKSGILGGAVAALLDVAVALAGGIGGVSAGKALRLAGVAVGLLAALGGLAGLVLAGGARVARGRRPPARWSAALATLAGAPLLVWDAFALFRGPQAAKIPAHVALSLAIVAVGLGALYGLARGYQGLVAEGRAPRRLAGGLVVVALALAFGNRFVLPRLYGWFHDTLSVATLVLSILAARLVVREARAGRLIALGGAAVVAAAAAVLAIGSSQMLGYVAHERTAVTALALRALPPAVANRPAASAERRPDATALPPLPVGPRRPQADVLVITIDALRADHVGAYGYRRPTTPHIDALAAGGVRFARAYAQAPHTSFSVASLMTGKYFATLARIAPGEHHEPIAAVMRSYGWRTAAFYPPAVFFVDAQKTKSFADSNFDFEYVKFEYIDAQKRVDQMLAYYDGVGPKRTFVWVHFFEPHEPYVSHPEFPFGAGDIDRYDSEIAYADAAVGRLVAAVRARRPGMIVVVAADHGEEFDEHGGRYHGTTLYDEQLRIPLVISVPGVTPHVVEGQVQLIDVTPTLLNLLDIPVPARMRGTDLGPWLATPPAPAARLPPAFAEVDDKRMMVIGADKLLCDLRWGACASYDLAADPGERKNLAEERPARAAELRGLLDAWLDGHVRMEPLVGQGARIAETGGVPRAIERGRLGDVLAAPGLAAVVAAPGALPERREAIALLVGLPPRPETAGSLSRAASDPDPVIAAWAKVGAFRVGDPSTRPAVQAMAADPAAEPKLRARAALALAGAGDPSGLEVLGGALDRCEDVLFCRDIITTLGRLRDRRAVPILLKHLPEVQNRREMVVALGEIGDPAAANPLLERLARDEYVTVRIEAARALARLGDARLGPRVGAAVRHETEPTVVAAARAAEATLGGRPN